MARPHIKILVADDDPEDLELMEEHILSVEPRAQLDKFNDGLSAYEYLHSRLDAELPSLIILDYNMPGLNGCEVLSSIKTGKRYKAIPKVILSNSNTPKFIEACLDNGATEYIVKPADMDAIHDLAKKLVLLATDSR